jgi:hypothetical protein
LSVASWGKEKMKYTFAILLAILAFGCSSVKSSVTALPWNKNEIVGHQFDLVSTNEVEQFSFLADGNVPACMGTKEAVCGPIFSWYLDARQVLIITDIRDKSFRVVLQKVAFNADTVEVLRNGRLAKYKIKEQE